MSESSAHPDKYGVLLEQLRAEHTAYNRIGALRALMKQAADAIVELSTPSHERRTFNSGDRELCAGCFKFPENCECTPSTTPQKCGRCGATDEGGCMEIPCPLGARTSMRELEEQLRQWYVAASPYATPNALKEGLASAASATPRSADEPSVKDDLLEMLDAAIISDSYGVPGSDFVHCLKCGFSNGPGRYWKEGDWHDKGCMVRRMRLKYELDKPLHAADGGKQT